MSFIPRILAKDLFTQPVTYEYVHVLPQKGKVNFILAEVGERNFLTSDLLFISQC